MVLTSTLNITIEDIVDVEFEPVICAYPLKKRVFFNPLHDFRKLTLKALRFTVPFEKHVKFQ